MVRLDADRGTLEVLVPDDELAIRANAPAAPGAQFGTGRELFAAFRQAVGRADRGASVFMPLQPEPADVTA